MRIDLKSRPSWKEIAQATEVVGSTNQIKDNFLKAVQFASTQPPRGQRQPGDLSMFEQAALNLAHSLKPSVALVLAESSEKMLKTARAYKSAPNLDVIELCKQDAVQRWREEAKYMTRAPQQPQMSQFGQQLTAALTAQAKAARDIPAATSR